MLMNDKSQWLIAENPSIDTLIVIYFLSIYSLALKGKVENALDWI